jgi:hypothetical protein
MPLYYGSKVEHVRKLIDASTNEIILLSAYCKVEALREILKDFKKGIRLSLVVRFDKQDLSSNASDLEILNFILEKNGILYRNQKLHSKLFLADKKSKIFGSSNITGRGLGLLGDQSNIESISATEECELQDWIFANNVIRNSQIVTSEMIDEMKGQLEKKSIESWDEDAILKTAKIPAGIFVGDFPFSSNPNNLVGEKDVSAMHDLSIFSPNLKELKDIQKLREPFLNSAVIRWLMTKIGNQTLNFGKVTQFIHDALLDDPLPYRREIKDLQVNLYSWIKEILPAEIEIWVPEGSHSQLIKKKTS